MSTSALHPAQLSILETLRHTEQARFSVLMTPTGLTSDSFKFHLQKLQKQGHVEKLPTGQYCLTAIGKEFANNLDSKSKTLAKQPKVSVQLIVRQTGEDGVERYLFQERRRNPYFGYWGFIGGPVYWGLAPENVAAQELAKQTGLSGSFCVRSTLRKRNFRQTDSALLEDKLFLLIEATDIQGTLTNDWYAGFNAWLTLDELHAKERAFAEADRMIAMLRQRIPYDSLDVYDDETNY